MTVEQVIEMIDRLPLADRHKVAEHVRPLMIDDEEDSDIPLTPADDFKAMLDGRIDDLRSGRVKGLTTEELFRRLDERRR